MLFVRFDLRLVARFFQRRRHLLQQILFLEDLVQLCRRLCSQQSCRARKRVDDRVDDLAVVQPPFELVEIAIKLGQLLELLSAAPRP